MAPVLQGRRPRRGALAGRRLPPLLFPGFLLLALAACPAAGHGSGDAPGVSGWSGVFDIPAAGFYTWSLERNTTSGSYAHPSLNLSLRFSGPGGGDATEDAAGSEAGLGAEGRVARSGEVLQPSGAYKLQADERTWLSYFLLNISEAGQLNVSAERDPREFEQRFPYFQSPSGEQLLPAGEGHGHGLHHDHGHDHGGGAPESKAAVHWSKALGILSIIASAVLGVGLRLRCPALDSPTFFGYVNVLSGGMFISMAFFHILPETIEHMPDAVATLMTTEKSSIAVMVFAFMGFMLVLLFERVIFDAHGSTHAHEHEEQAIKEVLNVRRTFLTRSETMKAASPTSRQSVRLRKSLADVAAETAVAARQSQGREVELSSEISASSHGRPPNWGGEDGSFPQEQKGSHHTDPHDHHPDHDHSHAGTSAILLMASLSVHSVFEGVVVGTADSVGTVWLLVLIIVAHKWAAAFAIANQLTPQQRQSSTALILLAMFALATPVGAAIGWFIDNAATSTESTTPKVVESVLNSIAVGTLLYIGLVEVVPEEFTGTRNAISKFLVLLTAAVVVFVLTLLHVEYAHDHDHGGGHDHGHSHSHSHAHAIA